jgi:hypothetical protein
VVHKCFTTQITTLVVSFDEGVGETPVAERFVASIMDREYTLQSKSWYGRVPSYSNPSDYPSRDNSMPWLREAAKLVGILGRAVVLPAIPNGGEDGESRQKPRGLKKKESDSTMSA